VGVRLHGLPPDDSPAVQVTDEDIHQPDQHLRGQHPRRGAKDKDQAAGLEINESFILCDHQAYKIHIKSIALFIHNDDRVEVARGRFTDQGRDIDITRLESGMSFLQVKSSRPLRRS
jgi:hypothetical protein